MKKHLLILSVSLLCACFTASEVVASCNVPSGLETNNISSTSAKLSWQPASGATSYMIQYRVASSPSWTSVTTSGITYDLTGLTASTIYEWNILTVCSSGYSSYSNVINFGTSPS